MKAMACDEGRIYILLLNWNGWKDTITCLESVFRNDYPNYRVIVCDNDSKDGSIEYIKAWADSMLDAVPPTNKKLSDLVVPPVKKPISYVVYDRLGAESGVDKKNDPPLVLIQTGANLGFGEGNNVGMRYAMARNAAFIWLLNNDTIIRGDSLSQMVGRFRGNPRIGICGSTLFYYHNPSMTQSLGGCTYNKWFGIARNIGYMRLVAEPIDGDSVEKKMDYVLAASMLVSSDFLSAVGLMNEEYFFYYEEVDWATRAKGRFSLAYAPMSIVYHKEGATFGSKSSAHLQLRFRSEYFLVKNRIRFTAQYFPYAIPTLYVGLFITFLVRILKGQWPRAVLMLRVLFSKDKPKIN